MHFTPRCTGLSNEEVTIPKKNIKTLVLYICRAWLVRKSIPKRTNTTSSPRRFRKWMGKCKGIEISCKTPWRQLKVSVMYQVRVWIQEWRDLLTEVPTSEWGSLWERSSLSPYSPCHNSGKSPEQFRVAPEFVSWEETRPIS